MNIKAEQILTLIRCHLENDNDRFKTVAYQIAAEESAVGHGVIAQSIKDLFTRKKDVLIKPKFSMLNSEVSDFFMEKDSDYRLSDLVVKTEVREKIKKVIREYIQREKLRRYGLENKKSLLLAGPSGTGKTMTASVIAHELHVPLFVVRMEKIVTKFMGETSLKLGMVFDYMREMPGVFLFDEFDAIGQQRGIVNEVGEMRRILNSFLQMMERDLSDSIVMAATNDINSLDSALFRRFDDILTYDFPEEAEIIQLLDNEFAGFAMSGNMKDLLLVLNNKSHADICMICRDAKKESILNDTPLTTDLVRDVAMQRIFNSQIS